MLSGLKLGPVEVVPLGNVHTKVSGKEDLLSLVKLTFKGGVQAVAGFGEVIMEVAGGKEQETFCLIKGWVTLQEEEVVVTSTEISLTPALVYVFVSVGVGLGTDPLPEPSP